MCWSDFVRLRGKAGTYDQGGIRRCFGVVFRGNFVKLPEIGGRLGKLQLYLHVR